jgi:hypothetical protein
VASGNKPEGLNMLAFTGKGLTRHPGGAQGVASIVAVLNLQSQLLFSGHDQPTPMLQARWYYPTRSVSTGARSGEVVFS